jgi:5-methylcytosine-specific restriction endonuclease McrA
VGVRKFTPELLEKAAAMLREGPSYATVGATLGVNGENLRVALRKAGIIIGRRYRPAHNAKPLPPDAEIVQRYLAGDSVKAIAAAHSVGRMTISNLLDRHGVERRGRATAMRVRMARTPQAERLRLTEAAHASVRGKPRPEAVSARIARSHANRKTRRGLGENELAEALRANGYDVIQQEACGRYNIDLMVGSVAVELYSQGTTVASKPRECRKIADLLDRRVPVLCLVFRETWALLASVEAIAANIDGLAAAADPLCREVRCTVIRHVRVRNALGQLEAVPVTPSVHCSHTDHSITALRSRAAAERPQIRVPVPLHARGPLLALFNGLCAYGCGRRATSWDHIIPVSKGGRTATNNVVPACGTCNTSKGQEGVWTWLRRVGLTPQDAFWDVFLGQPGAFVALPL